MKITDIERMFTQKVMEFLADGYNFSTGTSTSFSRIRSYADMRKGMDLVRVSLEEDHKCPAEDKSILDRMDVLRIVVYKKHMEHEYQFSWSHSSDVMDSTEIISELYDVSPVREKQWFVEKDEAAKVGVVHNKRMHERYHRENGDFYFVETSEGDTHLYITKRDDIYKKAVLPFLRRQPRCKSKKISDIMWVKKEVTIEDGVCKVVYGFTTKDHSFHVIKRTDYEVK